MASGQQIKAQAFQARAPIGGILSQLGAQIIGRLNQIQRRQRGPNHRRGQRIGKQVRPRSLAQQVNHRFWPCNIAAQSTAQSLAEGARHQINLHPRPCRRAAPLRADKACGVAVIHHGQSAIVRRQPR